MVGESSPAPRLELGVPDQEAGARLDRFLAGRVGSRAKAQSLIDSERVFVDGRWRPKRHVVRAGERIEVEPEGRSDGAGSAVETGVLADVVVAWEDEYLMVVDKPAGVVVHPARGHWTGTLAQALAHRGAGGGGEALRAGIVHRLDRDTSGLLVVAKRDDVHR